MFKWNGSVWIKLETRMDGNDGGYSYFEAKTDSFSGFAIVGLKGNDAATALKPAAGINDITGTSQATDAAQAKKSPGFEVTIMITVVYIVYLFGRKNG